MYANDFAAQDGILKVHLIGHGEEPPKSDAFLLEYNGAYVLIDGGVTDCEASLQYLLEIRRALLGDVGDSDYKLKIRVMISHCHGDHVGALVSHVFPSPLIAVEEIYMPPNAELDERFGVNGDIKYRPDLQQAIAAYQPKARVVDLTFGTENRMTLPMTADAHAPVITLCPPWCNSGSPERVKLLCETLKRGEENPNIATMVTNNNSVWMHVRHGKRTFLFTGDTVKKNKPIGYEMPEEMIAAYADVLEQVDVVKFVHHGYKRDAAVDAIMSLSPQYVFVSTCLATADQRLHEKYPESDVRTLNCGIDTYIFETDGEQLTVTPSI